MLGVCPKASELEVSHWRFLDLRLGVDKRRAEKGWAEQPGTYGYP
jgi:hypothetical protein